MNECEEAPQENPWMLWVSALNFIPHTFNWWVPCVYTHSEWWLGIGREKGETRGEWVDSGRYCRSSRMLHQITLPYVPHKLRMLTDDLQLLQQFLSSQHSNAKLALTSFQHCNTMMPSPMVESCQLKSSKSILFGGFHVAILQCPCQSSTWKCSSLWVYDNMGQRPFLAWTIEESRGKPKSPPDSREMIGRSLKKVGSKVFNEDDLQGRVIQHGFNPTERAREGVSKAIGHGDRMLSEKQENNRLASSFQSRLLSAVQNQAGKISGFVDQSHWRNYTSTSVAAPTSPFPPFIGGGLVGLGGLVFIAVALVQSWGRLRQGSRALNAANSETMHDTSTHELHAQSSVTAPIALSLLLQSDLKKKESVEWVNMVLGKIWNLYRRKLEGWLIELLQPLIDEIPEKPPYVQRVQVKQFFLGDEPLSIRSVERRTSRRANDLQYHIGLRYTGNSRMVFSITLKWGFLQLTIPVGVRGLDVDGEMWVKLRLIPTEPWVGTATWAFVSLPKITLALAPFRLLNVMAIPFLNIFLTKLLTQDLPLLFVRPNKTVVNFLKGKVVGPVSKDFKDGLFLRGFAGELSITLIEARKLPYFPIGKTDPYVVLFLGEQVLHSKKNSKTSIIGPPGAPVWNQDFRLLVVDPKTQQLLIRVRDAVGLTAFTVASVEVDLSTLQDTEPVDKVLSLQSGWGPFPKRFAGELLVRLTYKAYVEDEEEAGVGDRPLTNNLLDEIGKFLNAEMKDVESSQENQSPRENVVVSVDAQNSDKGYRLTNPLVTRTPREGSTGKLGFDGREGVRPSHAMTTSDRPTLPKEPAVKQQQRVVTSWRSEVQRIRESSALGWLALVTAVALLVALNLNLTNLFNP